MSPSAVVRFTKSKKEAIWDGAAHSILELTERLGFTPELGCRFGSCGSCEVRLKKVTVGLWGGQEQEGELYTIVRICSVVPMSSLVELEF